MGKWRYVALGVALFLVFLVVTFPAQYAYALAKKKFAPDMPVVLTGIQGTLWSGRAAPVMINGQRMDSLAWSIHPWTLLIGRVQARLEFRNGDSYGQGVVARGFTGKIYLKNLEAHIGLQRMRLFTQALPVGMEGSFILNLKELSFNKRTVLSADGMLAWDNAVINSPQRMEFGNLRAALTNDDEIVKATLSDGGGALNAEGLLNIARDGNYKFTGVFGARDANQRGLVQGLQFLGRPGPDGKITVSTSGPLANLVGYFEKPAAAAPTSPPK